MEKEFDVKSFVEEYEKQAGTDKEMFLKTKLKTEKYLSYADKIAHATKMVKHSSYALKDDNGELKKTDIIEFNSPMRYVLFVMTVVDKYTNIKINFKDVIPDFDALNFHGLIEIIFAKIGEKETNEFNTVLEMVLNDFITNKYGAKNYIIDIVSRVTGLAKAYVPLIDKIVGKLDNLSEEDAEKISDFIDKKIMKFIK